MTAASDLATKLIHEKRLASSARGLMRALALRLRMELRRGIVPNLEGIGAEVLIADLRDHYSRVRKDFQNQINEQLDEDIRLTDVELGLIDEILDRDFEARASEISSLVMSNAQKTIEQSVRRARFLVDESEDMRSEDIPQLATNLFLTTQIPRANTLGCTETQWSSERAKGTEVAVMLGQEDGELKTLQRWEVKFDIEALKTWRSQGDSRVRTFATGPFDHLIVDGQRITTTEFFSVGGESLRWPGDVALGASRSNVIGCRCSAIYDVASVAALRRLFMETIVQDVDTPFVATESENIVGATLDQ